VFNKNEKGDHVPWKSTFIFLLNKKFSLKKFITVFRSPKQNYKAISFTIGNWAGNRSVRFAYLNYVRMCLHPQSTHSAAIANFWRFSYHDGKISPGW
jgi:hypothetical protein